jgi:heme oxygenase
MRDTSVTLARLGLETRAFHADADALWQGLMVPEITSSQYLDTLIRVFGFEGPIEAALAYTPRLELVIDVHERFRAGFIAQDLLALGMRPGEISLLPQCVVAPFASPLEALGWMYVVERAILLHAQVHRHIHVRMPQARDACVYLGATGATLPARWQELGNRIERAIRTPRMLDDVVNGAHAAFRCWIDWSTRVPALQQLG